MPQYSITSEAEDDLSEIIEHISQDSVYQADLWLGRIYNVFELIAYNPQLGRERSDFTDANIRFYPFGNYFIVYHEIPHIEILGVISSYRDISALLEKASLT